VAAGTGAADRVPLSPPQPGTATAVDGSLYFLSDNGLVRSVSPRTGRQEWQRSSSIEFPGLPVVAGRGLYLASRNGRVAALDRHTGLAWWTRPAPDSAEAVVTSSEPATSLVLVDDALYVTFGYRSVFSIDVTAQQP
jgi:outer membrane protein assembly factor BamB